jgi:predicted regulator of Ras-like GTPase activity (Roadblock/LC7/MglB family)
MPGNLERIAGDWYRGSTTERSSHRLAVVSLGATGSQGAMNQLVMYEEELLQISNICEVLHRDSNARAVLVIDKNGQAIAQAGDVQELDVTSLSSLTAGNVAATGGIAQLLAEKEFAGQFHEGEKTNVHISIVGQRVILVVLFDERSSLGLVRLRVRKAAAELTTTLEVMVKKSQSGSQPSVFSEITDDDIDNLFND